MRKIRIKLTGEVEKRVSPGALLQEIRAEVADVVSVQYTSHRGRPHHLRVNVEIDLPLAEIPAFRQTVRQVWCRHDAPAPITLADALAGKSGADRQRFIEKVLVDNFGHLEINED